MPRTSRRKNKRESEQAAPQIKYCRTCIYVRLSRKDGGHGRKDSIHIQKQICMDFVKKHPEMLVTKIFEDNGVTGTTFQREAFEQLMEEAALLCSYKTVRTNHRPVKKMQDWRDILCNMKIISAQFLKE